MADDRSAEIADTPGPRGDTVNGVLLRLTGCTVDGETISTRWKAYTPVGLPAGSTALRWDFPWILDDVGYKDSKHTQGHRHIKDNWPRWKATVLSSGLDPSTDLGESEYALKRGSTSASASTTGQEYWASTAGLLALLADWAQSRRTVQVRDSNCLLLRLLLERGLSGEEARRLATLRPLAAELGLCTKEPVVDGQCQCLRTMLRTLPADVGMYPQALISLLLRHLSGARACEPVKAWFARFLKQAAGAVEDSCDEWGDFTWHHSSDVHLTTATGKRRRVDFHVKQYCVKEAVQNGSYNTSAAACKAIDGMDASQGQRWIASELAAYRAEGVHRWWNVQILSVAIDAGRLGKPGKELLVGFASCVATGAHGILPPQALHRG